MITKICKRVLLTLFTLQFSFLSLEAQTVSSIYQPGVTAEGAVYFLPKTAVNITIQVEKTTYTPGDFCLYAERYLRIKDVSPTPDVSYRITAIRQEAIAVADTAKRYAVKFDPKTSAANVRLSDNGILLGINTNDEAKDHTLIQNNSHTSHLSAPTSMLNPRQYMNEETLSAGSTAKMAELTAQDIYEIRESRSMLVRGQADNMPKDGEQLRLMLNQLDVQDHALTSLFTGTLIKDTVEQVFTVIPENNINHEILFRFSRKLGLVDKDDFAGVPYPVYGIFVNIPGRLRSSVSDSQAVLISNDFPAGQFGNVELLSGALFNKHYTTHLWLNPISGAIERLDAEQPR